MFVLPLVLSLFTFMSLSFFDKSLRENVEKDLRHFSVKLSRSVEAVKEKNAVAYEKIKRKKEEAEKCFGMRGHMKLSCIKNLQRRFEEIEEEVERELEERHHEIAYIYR